MSTEGPPPAASLAGFVHDQWDSWFDEPAPVLQWVLQGTGRPVAQTSVMLHAVEASTGEPRLVAKVNRHRTMRAIAENELACQKMAYSLLPESVARPLGVVDLEGDLHIIAEHAPSTLSWHERTPDWRREREAMLVHWLATLHDRSQRVRSHGVADLVVDVRDAYFERFQPSARVRDVLMEATDMVVRDSLGAQYEMLVHGDFWSGNWLFGDRGFTVIDWEHAGWRLSSVLDEFMHPLSEISRLDAPSPTVESLSWLSDAYRRQRGIATRSNEDCILASVWVAAEVATRTHRRWGVVEEWSRDWVRLTQSLGEMHEDA